MEGVVTSYSGTTLIANIDTIGGVATAADWNINLAGQQGVQGTVGAPGPSGTTSSYVNKFRNGAFDISQRGASGTASAGATTYSMDGWMLSPTGAASTWSQQVSANITGGAMRINCVSGMTVLNVRHRIESEMAAQLLRNDKTPQPVTCQFLIYNNSGVSITPTLTTGYAGAIDDFTTVTQIWRLTTCRRLHRLLSVWSLMFTLQLLTRGYQVTPGLPVFLMQVRLCRYRSGPTSAPPRATLGLTASPPVPELRPIR
jgi:hypothetical protein